MNAALFVEGLESRKLMSASPLTIGNVTVAERAGGTIAVFTVKASGSLGAPVTALLATVDGTAKAGGDYTSMSKSITLAPGKSTSVSVRIKDDRLDEPDESLSLRATLDGGKTVTGRCVIKDNDAPPVASIANVTSARAADGPTTTNVKVTLSSASGFPVVVRYSTKDGTALAGRDYVGKTASVTILPGHTSATFPLVIKARSTTDKNQFVANLTTATNASVGVHRQGVVTIKATSSNGVFAPASFFGGTVHGTVLSGSAPFSTTGTFTLVTDPVTNAYVIHGDGVHVIDSSGTYIYTRTTATTAVLSLNDSFLGVTLSESLTFTSLHQGSYHIESDSVGGQQSGSFTFP